MKPPPELNTKLTHLARERRLTLVGSANMAHYYSRTAARAAKKAGSEYTPMLCGLELAPHQMEERPLPEDGYSRLTCAVCFEQAQWPSNKPSTLIFPELSDLETE